VQRVAMGPVRQMGHGPLPDLNTRELAILVPLIVLVFWVGLYPGPVLDLMEASASHAVNSPGSPIPLSPMPEQLRGR
ncbi:MAG: hypothetical protein ACRD88_17175, partial [Terriglobia bacterium]